LATVAGTGITDSASLYAPRAIGHDAFFNSQNERLAVLGYQL
jgi:hypothetical protein